MSKRPWMMTRLSACFAACIVAGSITAIFAASVRGDNGLLEIDWKVLHVEDKITSEVGIIADSPLMAFRGTAIIDERIGRVISALFDHERAPDWVEGLTQSIELRALENHAVLVWQWFNNPWPVKDRDFVYLATPEYNVAKKFFRARFVDLGQTEIILSAAERAKIPDQSCCVIGRIIHVEWQFRATGPNSTCARVESIIDPKGLVPAMFVNRFQQVWPRRTLSGLSEHVRKTNLVIYPGFGQWTADEPGAAISVDQCVRGRFEE